MAVLEEFDMKAICSTLTKLEDTDSFCAMALLFTCEARKSEKNGEISRTEAYRVLSRACGYEVRPTSESEFSQWDYCKKIELTTEDIHYLEQLIPVVATYSLKGRLADLLWLSKKPRNKEDALTAIEAYTSIEISDETWCQYAEQCYHRAITLAKSFKGLSDDHLETIQNNLLIELQNATSEQRFYGYFLAKILLIYKLAQPNTECVAGYLIELGEKFIKENDWTIAEDYFRLAAKWYEKDGQKERCFELITRAADVFVEHGTKRLSSGDKLAALIIYNQSIEKYRLIPKEFRKQLHVESKIDSVEKLRKNLQNNLSMADFSLMEVGDNIPNQYQKYIESIKNFSQEEAWEFIINHPIPEKDKIYQQAANKQYNNLICHIATNMTLSDDKRIIGMSNTSDMGDLIHKASIEYFSLWSDIFVSSELLPALSILNSKPFLTESDFIDMAKQSKYFPSDRANLVGKGIYAGYQVDFVTAIHFLIPQIEHMVRIKLQEIGVTTSNTDSLGLEQENGLSTLMKNPEVEEIFGKDETFYIQALFCDGYGPNLRNNLAHGLLDENSCQSASAKLAWLFALRWANTSES
ncbi:DUF4209 domain-containing protein [Cardiobacteriaceae bacterium TAE3-ERU3]|nr:DUF4209 domain-containing protein [Cardiobacteriaceae bacterium TAE3-ERU3]